MGEVVVMMHLMMLGCWWDQQGHRTCLVGVHFLCLQCCVGMAECTVKMAESMAVMVECMVGMTECMVVVGGDGVPLPDLNLEKGSSSSGPASAAAKVAVASAPTAGVGNWVHHCYGGAGRHVPYSSGAHRVRQQG
jgi:hypothetical protein